MNREQYSLSSDEPLARATAALLETPIQAGPSAEAIDRAEQISATPIPLHPARSRLALIAASLALASFGLLAFLMLPHTAALAFADVVQALNQTHTFTGKMNLSIPAGNGLPSGIEFTCTVSVKGSQIRADSLGLIAVEDQSAQKALVLIPLLHQAISMPTAASQKIDLYALLRDYQTGTEKRVDDRIINGQKFSGFQVTRPSSSAGQQPQVWTFWIDPATRLPVQIDLLDPNMQEPISMTDLHFDVPLADSLFEMTIPAGYTVINDSAGNDPWKHYKLIGQVFDERGKPIAGVEVTCSSGPQGDPIKTDLQGRFSIDAGVDVPSVGIGLDLKETRRDDTSPIRLNFRNPNFLPAHLEDMRLLPPELRGDLHIRLLDGKTLAGRVLDGAGKPVAGAMVESVFGRPQDHEIRHEHRRTFLTDANGKFELHGLDSSDAVILVRKTDPGTQHLWGQAKIDLGAQPKTSTIEIVARPLDLPRGTQIHTLFGMKLVDVDDDLRARLGVTDVENVLVLDPGHESDRLGIIAPQQGDCIWFANESHIKNFNDLARQLLSACEDQKKAGRNTYRVQILFGCDRIDSDRNGGGYFTLNGDDLAELQKMVVH